MKRIILGFLLAPLLGPIVMGSLIVLTDEYIGIDKGIIQFWFLTFFVGIPFAYLYAAIIGLPIHFLLNRFNRKSWQDYTIAMSFSPLLMAIPGILVGQIMPILEKILFLVLLMPICGLVGYCFWFITIKNDKKSNNWPQNDCSPRATASEP